MRFKKILFFLAILAPVLIVFKNFFIPGPLAWGDAPHFFPEQLRELTGEPLAWTNRGFSFGGVNNTLWLSPLMIIYGLLGNVVGNDLTIRILFYFPSLILTGFGTYLFTKYLKVSTVAQFFSVLIYLLNTYYLLLIDGGQVGVALAYGIFPLTLLHLKKLVDKNSLNNFFLAVLFLFLCGVADPRVAIITLVTVILWSILEGKIKKLIYLVPLVTAWLGLNMYWIYPLLKNGIPSSSFSSSELKIIKWYEPLLLFSPHWPANLFGKIVRPPLYFLASPIIIFLGVFLKREKKSIIFALLFLIFAFLSNGIPLIDLIPFGTAFRDSTKFFIPLVLFGGILIGQTAERLQSKFFAILIYGYLLLLISPALLGKMNFVLSSRLPNNDLKKIYENLKSDNSFGRSVWFPERHPLAYETQDHPAIDAKDLADFRPFASINASEDIFNFLNNENFVEWFAFLGVKYLILSDNPREISKTEKDQKSWDTIRGLVASNSSLEKINWGTQIPVYKVNDVYPRFFAVKQLVAVIGPSIAPSGYPLLPSVYFEDGKLDPHLLEDKDPNSAVLVFNGKDKTDLAMSFLQKYFISPKDAIKNQWALYSPDQYLKYKYELLIRGVKFSDFDYGKEISFSTKKGEKIEFTFKVPENGEYLFLTRTMTPSENQATFKWKIKNLELSSGVHTEMIENNNDLQILNTVALVPKKDYEDAQKLSDTFTKYFRVVNSGDIKTGKDYILVNMDKWGTLKYKFEMPQGFYWLIFSDSYNQLWKLRQGTEYFNPVPVYSMVNGFYAESKWSNIGIEFKGQENVRWGIYWSTVSILVLSIIYLWHSSGHKKEV